MKHSILLSRLLLAKHHTTVVGDDKVYRFPPKTPDAANFWKHTGVCPACSRRSITGGRCDCGWRAP